MKQLATCTTSRWQRSSLLFPQRWCDRLTHLPVFYSRLSTLFSFLIFIWSDSGSDYTFLDKEAEPGTWVYRVTDVDQQGRQSDLSQTIVTVQSSNEQRTQVIALVAVIVLLAAFAAVGLSLDPISSL